MPTLGSARHDENGNYHGGVRGDQTGEEVSFLEFYTHSKGWRILRATSTEISKKIASAMIAACNNPHIGYNQDDRNSLYNAVKNSGFNISSLTTDVNTDCSALVRVCVNYAGVPVGDFTTSDEASVLKATGKFIEVNFESINSVILGDILVTKTKGHTVVVVSAGNSIPTYSGGSASESSFDLSSFISNLFGGTSNSSYERTVKLYKTIFEERSYDIIRDEIRTVDVSSIGGGGYTNLVSYPSLVETPFIILKVGNYTFGKYTKEGTGGTSKINFPNYIENMTVEKLNGQLNLYTINLSYLISTGDDPNLLDKIFSKVGFGKVYISYGDYSSPTFVYKEEEAIITKVTSAVDFSNSRIGYLVKCTSTALLLASNTFDFPKRNAKPSSVILEMLYNSKYGLTEVFTGMISKELVIKNNLIPTDDREVEILEKTATDPLTYIQYLVSCMNASTNKSDDVLKDSTYRMSIFDDNFGDYSLNGPYFKILKILSSAKSAAVGNVYEVDIGYPTENLVMSFSINTDNSWNLLYNYSDNVKQPQYTYDIDNNGNLVTTYSPNIAVSSSENKMTETLKSWWTNMTQFPILANLVLKGLVRPTILMTYIKINALFYGLRHISSGLYIITGQTDSISGSGYRTSLSLTRIAGDNDYILQTKTTVTSMIPVGYELSEVKIESENSSFFGSLKNTLLKLGMTSVGTVSDPTYSASSIEYTSTGSTELNVWNALMSTIKNPFGAAAVMGNIYHESGLKPNCLENTCKIRYKEFKNISYTDDSYTKGVDSGSISKEEFLSPLSGYAFGSGTTHQFGYGLVLWTSRGRKEGLYNLCKSRNVSISNEKALIDYLIQELNSSYKSVLTALTNATDIKTPTDIFLLKFEAPNNWLSHSAKRVSKAQEYYNKYAGKK